MINAFDYGVDIVCYSATKYLAGHGIAIAGLVVEKGGFNWLNGRFPQFNQFYDEYKKSMSLKILNREMFTKRLRIRFLTDFGGHLSPQSAFYLLQGIETLSLRMERHVQNAQKIAEFLEAHPKIEKVDYPGLPSSPYYHLSKKYFPKGSGAILSIQVVGGLKATKKVLEEVKIFDYMVNVGDAKSLIVHPVTSTHFGQSKEALEKVGINENTLRLSIGIEDVEDLIEDLRQALDAI